MTKCYCGNSNNKLNCCEPYLNGTAIPKTAEALMRSRYSAYVTANIEYILSTHHSSTRPNKEQKSILSWTKSVKWLGLKVHSTQHGLENQSKGHVHFSALFLENGRMDKIEENSFFIKEDGRWFYYPTH